MPADYGLLRAQPRTNYPPKKTNTVSVGTVFIIGWLAMLQRGVILSGLYAYPTVSAAVLGKLLRIETSVQDTLDELLKEGLVTGTPCVRFATVAGPLYFTLTDVGSHVVHQTLAMLPVVNHVKRACLEKREARFLDESKQIFHLLQTIADWTTSYDVLVENIYFNLQSKAKKKHRRPENFCRVNLILHRLRKWKVISGHRQSALLWRLKKKK
jgi:hypothetical protein